MKAVKRFKNAIAHKRPLQMEGILERGARMVQSPQSISRPEHASPLHKTRSVDTHDRKPIEAALVAEGVHRDIEFTGFNTPLDRPDSAIAFSPTSPVTPTKNRLKSNSQSDSTSPISPKRVLDAHPQDHRSSSATQPRPIEKPNSHGKGHAHDPLTDHLFLAVGPGGSDEIPDPPAVSESPPAAEVNIYETAYHEEIERIREKQGKQATLYLTRRVDKKKEYQDDVYMVGIDHEAPVAKSGFAKILDLARRKGKDVKAEEQKKVRDPEEQKEQTSSKKDEPEDEPMKDVE